MLFWIMSDRALPRSFRMMEGFGVHTFRLLNEQGKSTYVKFHWRPKLGMASVVWDEALKINGADPECHRRDLWNAIEAKMFPEWELGLQLFDEAFADSFDFDVLDATKLIPEEKLPLRIVGRMVLDQNVDNYFAETEQVAFATTDVVPGIDFSNDPLLQGRNLSYIDTQLTRLGGPNYEQIPVNRPRCPVMNMQRDGHMTMIPQRGRVSYSPSSLEPDTPCQDPNKGYKSFPAHEEGDKLRVRSETFSDHFSQPLLFFNSQTEPEQNHIIAAFVFELSKVQTEHVRLTVLGQLANVSADIVKRVAAGLGITDPITPIPSTQPARTDLALSPALSMVKKMVLGIKTKQIGILVADGTDSKLVAALRKAAVEGGAEVKVVATKVGGVRGSDGTLIPADFQLAGGSSVLFEAVYVALSAEGAARLVKETAAVGWVQDAFSHLKVIGATDTAQTLLAVAGVSRGSGVLISCEANDYMDKVAHGRIYDREALVRTIF